MPDWVRWLIGLGVSDRLSATDQKCVRNTNVAALIGLTAMAGWGAYAVIIGHPWVGVANEGVALAFAGALYLNRACRPREATALAELVILVQLCGGVVAFGSVSGVPWFALLNLPLPYLIFQRRDRSLAHLFAVVFAGVFVISTSTEAFPMRLMVGDPALQRWMNAAIAAGGLWVIAALAAAATDQTEDALEAQRKRADRLLLNVLPPAIADRLKAEPDQVIADNYASITVLFADIVGFTPLSARLPAERTVELLNQVFTEFDRICQAEGVEKLRTIGDGYMAVAGAPVPREDHAQAMVRVAVAIRDYMATEPTGEALQVRIGLNTGPAVGAIVGTSRFHFDVWGDAVNVAARMESTGEPGKIQIARGTWEAVQGAVPCESRGEIEVKGKGKMQTWFVAI